MGLTSLVPPVAASTVGSLAFLNVLDRLARVCTQTSSEGAITLLPASPYWSKARSRDLRVCGVGVRCK